MYALAPDDITLCFYDLIHIVNFYTITLVNNQNNDRQFNAISRRQWLCDTATLAGGLGIAGLIRQSLADDTSSAAGQSSNITGNSEFFVPIRSITHGPKFHWFSYYDKLQFDPSGRFALGMAVDFQDRRPNADDVIKIGMIDLQNKDEWIDLGQSRAWSWQQGCMLQWRPGSSSEILWNDRQNGKFICHILNVNTREKQTIEHPVYCVSPDGRTAMTLDYERIQDIRPGYGYCGIPDPNHDVLAPDNAGVYRIDLQTGKKELVISIAQAANLGTIPDPDPLAKHYLHHLLFSPDGSRFIMLHRWLYPNGKLKTRMLTAKPDGSDIYILDDNGIISHFIWRDNHFILSESKRPPHGFTLYLFQDKTSHVQVVDPKVFEHTGHCNYLPGAQWILNDTYPIDNQMTLFLYHIASRKKLPLGKFYAPPVCDVEFRCDLHARVSLDGRGIVVDSLHGGNGRQMYLLDISNVTEKSKI